MLRLPALLFLTLLATVAPARDTYLLFRHNPTPVVLLDSSLLIGNYHEEYSSAHFHYEFGQRWTLLREDCATGLRRDVSDSLPLDTIWTLTRNSTTVFAAGSGVAVTDLASGTWRRLARFDGWLVRKLLCDDSLLWLGTDGRGLVRFDLRDSSLRAWTADDGVGGNSVFSLFRAGDDLYVGLFRFGDPWRYPKERRADVFGLGLYRLDLASGRVERESLPPFAHAHELRRPGWLVADAYRSPADAGALRLVLWSPWAPQVWDLFPDRDSLHRVGNGRYEYESVVTNFSAARCPALAARLGPSLRYGWPGRFQSDRLLKQAWLGLLKPARAALRLLRILPGRAPRPTDRAFPRPHSSIRLDPSPRPC